MGVSGGGDLLHGGVGGGVVANQMSVHFSSATDQHNTPIWLVEKVRTCLGSINLDPATNLNNPCEANRFFTPEDSGLGHLWVADTLYLNPPYGREIRQWTGKLAHDYQMGRIGEAIALLPARTDTAWWFDLRIHLVCFLRGRLKFNDCKQSAPFPSALFYLGPNWGKFYQHFYELGLIYRPIAGAK